MNHAIADFGFDINCMEFFGWVKKLSYNVAGETGTAGCAENENRGPQRQNRIAVALGFSDMGDRLKNRKSGV